MRGALALLSAAACAVLLACGGTPAQPQTQVRALTIHRAEAAIATDAVPKLRVATLNIAHGRGDSLNQMLVTASATRENLDAIGRFLRENAIHIAALQEVDSPSWWSGGFDHAAHLATSAGFTHWAQADHASLGVGHYGTAVMSTLPLTRALALDFAPSPPTATKGFTLAEISWPTGDGRTRTLDVISIHMDFSRESVRRDQLRELERVMAGRSNPLIIMGDFNSEGLAAQLIAQAQSNDRQLHTLPREAGAHHSYKDKRLDWIIASGDLEIVDYQTAPEQLSDHRVVLATLVFRRSGRAQPSCSDCNQSSGHDSQS